MKYAILGGGGVFGMHLACEALDYAHSVISIGRNPFPAPPWTLTLEDSAPEWFRYEQIHILHEFDRLTRLLDAEKPDIIVNFAALAYATSWEDSARYYETNVVALARLTEWLTGKPWLHRFIQIGTSELYGSVSHPVDENAPLRPSSPYAVSKMAADMHIQTLKGFPGIILRPSNCFGEAQQLYRIVPRASWSAYTGNKLPLEGGGVVRKSYMHAQDLATAIQTVIEHGQVGQVYNAGPDEPIMIRELVETVAIQTNILPSDLFTEAPPRAHEDAVYWLNSDRLRKLGWTPQISLLEGVRRVNRWVKDWLPELGQPKPFVLRA